MHALITSICIAASLFIAPLATAQTWPSKPIKLVVPYPPGGPLDTVARALADKIKDPLAQPVIVENKPGAGGNIGADQVAKSAADGYTLVMGAVATHAINPHLYAKMPYDALKDFAPVTLVANVPNVLVITSDFAAKHSVNTLADFVALLKRNPGKFNFASGGNGSAGHLAGELLKARAGVFAVHIPYPGAAPAQLGLLAGQTDFMFDNLASASGNIKGGKLKALAVTTAARAASFADVPTVSEAGAEQGLKGFDISTWFGIFAPAKTTADVIARLNREMSAALRAADMKERLARLGAEGAPMLPEQFAAFVAAEHQKYAELVKRSGARID
ncbi:MAG: Bug family tripartite tricarboxylate transporter substrate binding protein [Burkholderiaceae bacterium]